MRIYTLLFLMLTQLNGLIAQDGILDTSFGIDGIVQTDILDSNNDVAKSVVVQPDNKIIVAGYTTDSLNHICLVRYNNDGSKDNNFGTNGIVITYFPAISQSRACAIALQEDGKIVVGGSATQGLALVRYNTNGTLDNSFGEMGIVTTSLSTNSLLANAVEVQQDGKIVLGGSILNFEPDGFAFILARFNQNGSLDFSFGNDGIAITDITVGSGLGALDLLDDLALQEDGKIVASGISGPSCVLVRYNSNGSLDNNFGANGIVIQNFSITGNSAFKALGIQQNGKIIAAGFSTNNYSDFLIARYDSSGNLDSTFGTGGSVTSSISPLQDGVYSLLVQPNDKILAGGVSFKDDNDQFTIVRYTTEGNIDPTFGVDGVTSTMVGSNSSSIASIAFQPDGKIVATGSNNTIPNSDFILARYTSELSSNTSNSLLQSSISIYPNPSHDYTNIDYYINDSSNITIELFDLNSKLVKVISKDVFKNKGLNKKTIQMQNLTNGIYFISISTSSDNKFFKIIKI